MLKVANISYSYLNDLTIDAISFSVSKGTNVALIGESGCGKSTLLKLIYGLFDLDSGSIFWNEQQVLGPKYNLIPGMDYMKYLAQDFDLMPYITVSENIGKYLSNIYPEKKIARISELLEVVQMGEYANVKAKFLSGGQMQRVAIARVLALEPEVLLLDEPFSHVDNFRKNSLRRSLFLYLKEKGITTIIATHDSTDVLSFSDEVFVMKSGKIIDMGKPREIYFGMKSKYISALFDDVNEIPEQYLTSNIENKGSYLVYPHQLKIVDEAPMKVKVVVTYFKGTHYLIQASLDEQILFITSQSDYATGTILCLEIAI